jgi:hypothetical protein
MNWKAEPVRARLLRFDLLRTYGIGDFLDFMPTPEPVRTFASGRPAPARWNELPGWLVELINYGVPNGGRSEACFKVILWLIRYGWSYDAILDAFQSYPAGIGQKMAEKGVSDGLRWFNITYDAARRVLSAMRARGT